jgi:hypothetical protein
MFSFLMTVALAALPLSAGKQYASDNEIALSRYPCAAKSYQGQAATVVTTEDGGLMVVGTVKRPGKYRSATRVVRLDPEGDLIWQVDLETKKPKLHSFEGKCLIPMPDGKVIAYSNAYKHPGSGGKTWLVALDGQGKTVWQKLFRGSGSFNTPFAGRFSVEKGQLHIEGHIYPTRADWKGESPKVWRAIVDGNGKVLSEEQRPWEERTF